MNIRKPFFVIGILLVCINLMVLTKYILFKQPAASVHRLRHMSQLQRRPQGENWVLFASIRRIYNSRLDGHYKFQNIGGNILGFVPLGFLLPYLFFRRLRLIGTVTCVFCLSLLFEVTQLYTGLGVFDVDDLVLNTVGGLLGCLIFLSVESLSRRSGALT